MTVNDALVLIKALRQRQASLESLRDKVSTEDRYLYAEKEKIQTPKYDVVSVDEKVVRIGNAILDLDTAIKRSNAKTELDITIDRGDLLSPLERSAPEPV